MAVRATEGGYSFIIGANASGFAFSGQQRIPTFGPASYTVWVSGSLYQSMNNTNGLVEFSGTVADAVFANTVAQLTPVGRGGTVHVRAGTYTLVSGFAISGEGTTILKGEGDGFSTILSFTPAGAITDGIRLRGLGHSIQDMKITATNTNITNLVHIQSVTPHLSVPMGSFGLIRDVVFFGPNHTSGGSFNPTSGMAGILLENPSNEAAWFWKIENCHFGSLGDGITTSGTATTSMRISDCTFLYCTDGIDLVNAQHLVTNCWFQGSSMVAGVRLRGTAAQNIIHGCMAELQDANRSSGQSVAAVILESGATRNVIMGTTNNLDSVANPNVHTVLDNSTRSTNWIEYLDTTLSKGRLRNARVEGLSAVIQDSATTMAGDGDIIVDPLNPDKFMLVNIRPSISGVPADTGTRVGVRFHNMEVGTDQEYLQILANGSNGYVIDSNKSTSGEIRRIRVQAAGVTTISSNSGIASIDRLSGYNFLGTVHSGKTGTPANSGAFDPAGYMQIQVSGVTRKVPYFAV